jgi:hypothetical protein
MSSTSRRRNRDMGNAIRYRNVQNGRRHHVKGSTKHKLFKRRAFAGCCQFILSILSNNNIRASIN